MSQESFLIWAHIDSPMSWTQWWPEFSKAHSLAEDSLVERFYSEETNWAQVQDALRSINLFSKHKVILVLGCERLLKKAKDQDLELFKKLNKGPYPVILQSSDAPPNKWAFRSWTLQTDEHSQADDRTAFRWIDAVQIGNLHLALQELERSSVQDVHPLVLIQLITRHYRMGRLIQHALEKRLSEQEIAKCLKLPTFVIQKWKRQGGHSRRGWTEIFDKLFKAEFELKSGGDLWCLRKLSFDLVELRKSKKDREKWQVPRPKPHHASSLFETKLLQVAPSFF